MLSGERAAEEQRVGQSGRQSRTWKNTAQGRPLCLLRNARCEKRCAEGAVGLLALAATKAGRPAYFQPMGGSVGLLALAATKAGRPAYFQPMGGAVGLLALAATEAGRPAYFQPMGRRGRLAGARRYGGRPAGLFPPDGAARAVSSPKPSWKAGLAPLRRSGGTSGCAKNSGRTSPPIRRCGL